MQNEEGKLEINLTYMVIPNFFLHAMFSLMPQTGL